MIDVLETPLIVSAETAVHVQIVKDTEQQKHK